jgi:hypothetical protein
VQALESAAAVREAALVDARVSEDAARRRSTAESERAAAAVRQAELLRSQLDEAVHKLNAAKQARERAAAQVKNADG